MVRRLSDKHMHLSAFFTNATVHFYFINYCLIARLDQPIYCSSMNFINFCLPYSASNFLIPRAISLPGKSISYSIGPMYRRSPSHSL